MNFRIYHLSPRIESNTTRYTADIMTNFSDQFSSFKKKQLTSLAPNTFHSYTFDETYKEDLNSKKTLTFSMCKNVFINGQYIINPFINSLQAGSLLLFVDMYDNHTFFMVTDINYTFSASNMTYKYTCEDMFSYTTSRLNSGYTLENDSQSEDFIGAKTIDWWVIKHIAPDCKISYQYIPFSKGVYQRKTKGNKIYPYKQNIDGSTTMYRVKKIIKQPYLDGVLSSTIRNKVNRNLDLTVEEQAEYDKYVQQHAYYESYAFSCSNSSANGALVSLADHFDLQIKVFERLDFSTGIALFYYWFEPKKNETKVTGLQYSPKSSIQNFTLGHSAKSLTTVLNVEGPTYDDELITLIPNVSPFFYQLFQSPVWEQSVFTKNSYSAFLAPQPYYGYIPRGPVNPAIEDEVKIHPLAKGNFTYELISIAEIQAATADTLRDDYPTSLDPSPSASLTADINAIKVAINEKMKEACEVDTPTGKSINDTCLVFKLGHLPVWVDGKSIISLYPHFSFGKSVIFYHTNETGEEPTTYTTAPYKHPWRLLLHHMTTKSARRDVYDSEYNCPVDTWTCYKDDEDLPTIPQEKVVDYGGENVITHDHYEYYLIIDTKTELPNLATEGETNTVILTFARDFTVTDHEFARAADRCPWLENKLIDTSYFKNYNLISRDEYRSLNNIIYNDLRKINGKLLCYSAAYYNAMHDKTQILANLTNNFESMGAACQAAIITPYEKTGVVPDYSYFTSAYNQAFVSPKSNNTLLFNYNETRTEYFNKYFNAQQRFLKNIYLFRDFWNSPVSIPGEGLYNYNLTINVPVPPETDTWTRTYYTFATTSVEPIPLDNDFVQYYDGDPASPTYGEPSVVVYDRVKTNASGLFQYIPAQVVSALNYKNYLINAYVKGDVTKSTGLFNSKNNYYKRAIVVKVKNTEESSPCYPFRVAATSNNSVVNGIAAANEVFKGIWLLVAESAKGAESFPANDYKLNQMYCYSSSYYKYDSEVEFPELTFCFSYNNDSNASTDYISGSDYTIVPVYYNSGDNTYVRVKTIEDFAPNYKGISLVTSASSHTCEYKYLPVSEREMTNNWIALGENIKKIYQPDYSMYLPISELIKGKNEVLPIFEVIDDSDGENDDVDALRLQLPIPRSEETYKRYMPIDTLFWFGKKSSFNVESSSSKTFEDVFTYYTKDNLITSSPTDDDKQYLPVSYVTEKNLNKFYKRTTYVTNGSINTMDSQLNTQYIGSDFSTALAKHLWARGQSSVIWTTEDRYGVRYNYWGASMGSEYDDGFMDSSSLIYSPINNGAERLLAFSDCGHLTADKYYSSLYANVAFTYNALQTLVNGGADDWNVSGLEISKHIKKEDLFVQDAAWINIKKDDDVVQGGSYYLINITSIIKSDNCIQGDVVEQLIKDGKVFKIGDSINSYKTSGVVWYPIINYAQPISFNGLNWEVNNRKTAEAALAEYLEKTQGYEHWEDDIFFTITQGSDVYTFILCERRDYTLASVKELGNGNVVTTPKYLQSGVSFLDDTGAVFNFKKENGLTTGYYTLSADTDQYVTPDEFDINAAYFTQHNNDYVRVYTIKQAIEMGLYFYFNVCKSTQQGFLSRPQKISLLLYKHIQSGQTLVTEEGGVKKCTYTYASEVVAPEKYLSEIPLNWGNSNELVVAIPVEGNTINLTIKVENIRNISFKNMNNGTFWYKFSRNSAYPICLSQAAAIEAQLTQYWSSAYTASKWCEYYLPEYWTHYVDNEENKMFNLIFVSSDNNLLVADTFVPKVKIWNRNGETVLDKFQWTYNPYDVSNKEDNNSWYNELTPEYVNPTDIKDNEAIVDILKVLKEDIMHFKLEKIGKQTYYYAESGGLYWNELLELTTNHKFEQYSGLYVMMYNMLNTYQSLRLDSYEQTRAEHDQLWISLRSRYGYALLEQSYKNSDATTADELYKAARYKFLDLQLPERKYTLTINDVFTLKGYSGQELHVGDPIELLAEDFYDKKDLIYSSLKQFLFISNISYTLRDPAKMSVTVNNIRYSDKLIDRLAQLLR